MVIVNSSAIRPWAPPQPPEIVDIFCSHFVFLGVIMDFMRLNKISCNIN